MTAMHAQSGFTLVEMMVGLVITTLLAIGALSFMSAQTHLFVQQAGREQIQQDALVAYDRLSRLLVQTTGSTISIADDASAPTASTALTPGGDRSAKIDLQLPTGFPIWPNDSGTFGNNAVRIQWSNTGADAYVLKVGADVPGGGFASMGPIAGDNSGVNPRVINFELWPLDSSGNPQALVSDAPAGGYRLLITMAGNLPDKNYTNPLNPNGPWKNYRTVSSSGTVMPRN